MQLLKGHWQLIAITIVIFALWQTPVVLPLKIFVVFLHELSHGLAAVLTGGEIEELSLSPQQGGHAVTRGGNRFAILTAGYLGSLFLGVVLLLFALRSNLDRYATAICGIVMLVVTALFMREVFPVLFCLATGAVLLAIAAYLPHDVNDMVLRVIGLSSLIYVPYDIFDDTIARAGLKSDAYMLAEAYGGSAMIWGVLWLGISLGVIALCLRYGIGADSNLRLRRKQT
ncbi:M50 family metallopeptidase [Sulfitobacter aestuariivivens]|uniref:M50 family metallopeptidase n=1 Tax=Sulfitobacter aestuariivivens TaxID=2766981 RepID=A0A927HFE3_9RHOB|nr:M50 family metallopeptidase [Sulfitobacter aestuariivivens]MBD3664856.1 M50 family metallopeptidase [Sulfitobacter aestuariivivens]